MSITSIMQTTYGIGSYASPVSSIRSINGNEQALTLPKSQKEEAQQDEQSEKNLSTDSTGIMLSEETKAFLSTLSDEEKPKLVSLEDEIIPSTSTTDSSSNTNPIQTSTAAVNPTANPEQNSTVAVNPTTNPEQNLDEEVAEDELTREQEAVIDEMKVRDAEVKAHEQAHVAAGGGLTSGISYSYQVGPDGQKYAVGGSVSIDTSTDSTDPDANIAKARQIKAAALAPAEPSGQDMAVAAAASQIEADARAAKAEQVKLETSSSQAQEVTEGLSQGTTESLPILNSVGIYAQNNVSADQTRKTTQLATLETNSELNKNILATQIQTASAVSSVEKSVEQSSVKEQQYKAQVANTYKNMQSRAA